MLKPLCLALFTLTMLGCGADADSNCVTPDLSGGWMESPRSTMTLSQTCEGVVSGQWTTLTETGVVASERTVSGRVEGLRFLWTAACVDNSCTYATISVDGTEGSGTDILDEGRRLMGLFSVPGRALATVDFKKD